MRHHLQILGTPADRGCVWRWQGHDELQLIWDGKLLPEKTNVFVEGPCDPRSVYDNWVTINGKTYKNCKVTLGLLKECPR